MGDISNPIEYKFTYLILGFPISFYKVFILFFILFYNKYEACLTI